MEALTCGLCGAKVRKDRPTCMRCGATFVATAAEKHGPTRTLVAAAAAFVVVALVGAVALRPAPPAPVKVEPLVAPSPSAAAAAPDAVVPATGLEPVVNSIDATRPGVGAYAKGDVPGAIEKFQHAIDTNPKDAEALNNLGQVLVRSKRAADALPYFDRAIVAAPGVWTYHFNRARALAELSRWSDAVAGYRDAQREFPDDYITTFNLARALQKNGDLQEAIDTYARAIRLAPGQADFHLSHGMALEAAKRPAEAVAAYKRYLELADPSPEADKVKRRIGALEGTAGAPQASPAALPKP